MQAMRLWGASLGVRIAALIAVTRLPGRGSVRPWRWARSRLRYKRTEIRVTVRRGIMTRTVVLGDQPEIGTSCPFCAHGRVTALVGTMCARCLAWVVAMEKIEIERRVTWF